MTDSEKKIDAKVKFAIDTARPAIKAASDAVHEVKFADADDMEIDYDMALAWVVKRLPGLCVHNMRVLNHYHRHVARSRRAACDRRESGK